MAKSTHLDQKTEPFVDNKGKALKGINSASISKSSHIEKWHKLILQVEPKAKIVINVNPDGAVKLTVNGVLFVVDAKKYSLDQRILHAFKLAYTEYMTFDNDGKGGQ